VAKRKQTTKSARPIVSPFDSIDRFTFTSRSSFEVPTANLA
jgi:hypothetical protein